MLKRLNYVGVPTRDQDRVLTFWTEAMGCIIATDRLVGEKRWIELTIPGAQTGLLLLTPEGQEDRVGTFFNGSFGCEDVRYAYEKLLARGVEFVAPPQDRPSPTSTSGTRTATPSSCRADRLAGPAAAAVSAPSSPARGCRRCCGR